MKDQLFAFWHYASGQGHTVLGSEVDEVLKNGYIRAKDYGGARFWPLLIVPLEQGKEMLKEIDTIRQANARELKAVITKHEKATAAVLKISFKKLKGINQ